MSQKQGLHVLTVGWNHSLIDGLANPISAKCEVRFSHLVHPRHPERDFAGHPSRSDIYFFRESTRQPLPEADSQWLASLESDGIPTIHNMILSDRVVSGLEYAAALRYATFLARRMIAVFRQLQPSVVIASFDALHSGLSLAVAKHLGIPWFAMHFTVVPPGLACFCDNMTPAARVQMFTPAPHELRSFAETQLQRFESRSMQASAYVTPPALSLAGKIKKLPSRLVAVARTMLNARDSEFRQFTESRNDYSVTAAVGHLRRVSAARRALAAARMHTEPPTNPFVLFGLHMQPESSIDVWAPFFSDQMWVIELLARSMPASHKLLVKIHKSDAAKYSSEQLRRMESLPGVELVQPFANAREFVDRADLIISIQGTMGLEAALLGKPVIMLGESPFTLLPSVSQVGRITDLPALVRAKLAQPPPARNEIVGGYAAYLAPFMPGSYNDWSAKRTDEEIDGYVRLFKALALHVAARAVTPAPRVSATQR